jgi:hypothetical protein
MGGLVRIEHGSYAPEAGGTGWSHVTYPAPAGGP